MFFVLGVIKIRFARFINSFSILKTVIFNKFYDSNLKSIFAGFPAARKAFKDIKATETAWNGRGTENLVILRVW